MPELGSGLGAELEPVFTTTSPWVVGREALLEYAVDDFLHHATRQQPWLRARFELLLGSLTASIAAELGAPPAVTALTPARARVWLAGLSESREQRELAERALGEFADYLVRWRWLGAHPLRQTQAV